MPWTYEGIAEEIGLSKERSQLYCKYMRNRWLEDEIVRDYAAEWAIRFAQNREYEASDSIGKSILRRLYNDGER